MVFMSAKTGIKVKGKVDMSMPLIEISQLNLKFLRANAETNTIITNYGMLKIRQ